MARALIDNMNRSNPKAYEAFFGASSRSGCLSRPVTLKSPMRREADFFGDREMDLVYIAKKLREALRLESAFTESGVDYAVETGKYLGGVLFRSERVGAFLLRSAGSRGAGARDHAAAWLPVSRMGGKLAMRKCPMSKRSVSYLAGAVLAVSLFAQNTGNLPEQYRESASKLIAAGAGRPGRNGEAVVFVRPHR